MLCQCVVIQFAANTERRVTIPCHAETVCCITETALCITIATRNKPLKTRPLPNSASPILTIPTHSVTTDNKAAPLLDVSMQCHSRTPQSNTLPKQLFTVRNQSSTSHSPNEAERYQNVGLRNETKTLIRKTITQLHSTSPLLHPV